MASISTKKKRKLDERQKRVAAILPLLKSMYPHAKCRLNFRTPLQLLIATILSAQSTDDRVNIVTRDLFRKYRTAADAGCPPTGLDALVTSPDPSWPRPVHRAQAQMRAMPAPAALPGGPKIYSREEMMLTAETQRRREDS